MKLLSSLTIFPTPDIDRTARFYCEKLGFRRVDYTDSAEPHSCLYRDAVEIVLTRSDSPVIPNRVKYGYGEDAYIITAEQEALQNEFELNGAELVRRISMTDYGNREFTVQDVDGRWLVFGRKEWTAVDERKQWEELYSRASHVRNDRVISPFVEAGGVSAAIMTASGNIYVGVCIDTASSLGMCAERSAIANMITNGESRIIKVLAIMPDGKIGMPCGACREFMMQLDAASCDIQILEDMDSLSVVRLGELCPKWWTNDAFGRQA